MASRKSSARRRPRDELKARREEREVRSQLEAMRPRTEEGVAGALFRLLVDARRLAALKDRRNRRTRAVRSAIRSMERVLLAAAETYAACATLADMHEDFHGLDPAATKEQLVWAIHDRSLEIVGMMRQLFVLVTAERERG